MIVQEPGAPRCSSQQATASSGRSREVRSMKTRLLSILASALLATAAAAAVPAQVSFQGVLTDNAGTILPDGNYALTFRLYTVANGGSAIWTETQNNVPVSKGGFSVLLGAVTPLSPDFDVDYWLSVAVGAGPELPPPLKLASAPYARHSRRSFDLVLPFNGLTSSTSPTFSITNNNSVSGSGGAILGTSNSNLANAFGVRGSIGANSPATTS